MRLAADRALTDDLSAIINSVCPHQHPTRAVGDQCVEVREHAILPNERVAWVGIVAGLAHHDARGIDGARVKGSESRKQAQIGHGAIGIPQDPTHRTRIVAGFTHHRAQSVDGGRLRIGEAGQGAKIGETTGAGSEEGSGESAGIIPGRADYLSGVVDARAKTRSQAGHGSQIHHPGAVVPQKGMA